MTDITAALAQIEEALKDCDEAMGYMSEYDIPLMLPENVKQALTLCRAIREAVPDTLSDAIKCEIDGFQDEFWNEHHKNTIDDIEEATALLAQIVKEKP